jgi:hypothetical protein
VLPSFADHIISFVNTELLDMYANSLLAAFSSFTGIDVASRLIARSIIYRQDALLEGRCTSRTDAPVAEEPIECHVDVLLREGRGRESYIEHSLVPFRGAQFGDCQHQLPLLAMQDANDAATYMTHMIEDLVDRISVDARGMGGSFNQRSIPSGAFVFPRTSKWGIGSLSATASSAQRPHALLHRVC